MKFYGKLLTHLRDLHDDEGGTQFVEYLAVAPLVVLLIAIGWQFFLAGNTIIIGLHATREGARALAVCGGGDFAGAVYRASPGYDPQIVQASRGGHETKVAVRYQIPTIFIEHFITREIPPVTFSAVMRTEKCR